MTATDTVNRMTMTDLRAALEDLGVSVPANARKTDLVQLYASSGGPGVVIEAEVVEDDEVAEKVAALVPAVRDTETALVRPAGSTRDIAAAFQEYARLCEEVLSDDDYQSIGGKRYRTKSAWRKLAVAYGVNVELSDEVAQRDDDGALLRVHCTVRATAPNGRFADGLGSCDATERKFSHLEHDVRATAYTRAANRACADLFGLGEVSAEEVQGETRGGQFVFPSPAQVKSLVEVARAAKDEGVDVGGPWPTVLGVRILSDTEPRQPVATEPVVVALTIALQHLRNTNPNVAVNGANEARLCTLDVARETAVPDEAEAVAEALGGTVVEERPTCTVPDCDEPAGENVAGYCTTHNEEVM